MICKWYCCKDVNASALKILLFKKKSYKLPGIKGKLKVLLRSPVKLGSSAKLQAFLMLASDSEFSDIPKKGVL